MGAEIKIKNKKQGTAVNRLGRMRRLACLGLAEATSCNNRRCDDIPIQAGRLNKRQGFGQIRNIEICGRKNMFTNHMTQKYNSDINFTVKIENRANWRKTVIAGTCSNEIPGTHTGQRLSTEQ